MKRPDITVLPAKVWVRRIASVVLFVLSVSVMVWIFWRNAIPLGSEPYFFPDDPYTNGGDFRLRLNEVECLRSGIDPYKVWNCELGHARFYPMEKYDTLRTEIRNEPINAYTPWEYSFLFPLSMLPRDVAWWLFYGLMGFSEILILVFAFRTHWSRSGLRMGLLGAACVSFQWLPVWCDVRSGNFALIISASLLAMIWALRMGRDCLAGFFYSIVMIKPQLGLLFSIPLLMCGRMKVIGVAFVVCVMGTVLPALLTGVAPWTLVFEAPKASAHAFSGCALMPLTMIRVCCGGVVGSESNLMLVAMFLGVVLCLWLTYCLRHCKDWLWLFVPASFLSVAWTYNQWHSFCVCALVIIAMVEVLVSTTAGLSVRILSVAVIFFAIRADVFLGKGLEFGCAMGGFAMLDVFKLLIRDFIALCAVVSFVTVVLWRVRLGRAEDAEA